MSALICLKRGEHVILAADSRTEYRSENGDVWNANESKLRISGRWGCGAVGLQSDFGPDTDADVLDLITAAIKPTTTTAPSAWPV